MQITQTAGLALATDVAPADKRPRVVALLYAMLLLGLILGSGLLSLLLTNFSPLRLIQVVQGCAAIVIFINLISLWKQEARGAKRGARQADGFSQNWRAFIEVPHMRRFLWTVGLGSAAFSMQDIVLEPYGGQILGLGVGLTSGLTALSAGGALLAFVLSTRMLRHIDAVRLAAIGALLGLPAFSCVIFSAPLGSPVLFQVGAALIGFGGGLFSVGMLLTAMEMAHSKHAGMVLGAWGAVQATASGIAMAFGGVARDVVGGLATQGHLGEVMVSDVTGYNFVFQTEMVMMFVVLIALGPLVSRRPALAPKSRGLGLAELPG
jgi:BCD family chlorophyll transporter-like MFS transporter